MAKRGRPKIVRELQEHTRVMLQRARQVCRDPLLGTPFGALAFEGHFTDYQLNTAEKIDQIYRKFDHQIGLKRWPVSPSFEVGTGLSPIFEDEAAREEAAVALREYLKLQDELDRFPPKVREALVELIVHKQALLPGYLPKIKGALDILAGSLGFKIQKKRLDKSKVA